jgi:cytochrome c
MFLMAKRSKRNKFLAWMFPQKQARAFFFVTLSCALLFGFTPMASAQLRGHGGPVRALAISADGKEALSGSFDTAAIRWSLARNAAEQVMRFHEGAVNAVAILPDGKLVTAGADAKIAIWTPGNPKPIRIFEGHQAPIVSIAVSPDGKTIASASWDRTIRLWPVGGGASRVLQGHTQNVNGVAFTPDGRFLVSASYDATVRIWPLANDTAPTTATLGAPLNALSITPDGTILAGGADGKIHFLSKSGERAGDVDIGPSPVIGLAVSHDGKRAAAATIRGSVGIVDIPARKLAVTLVGPGLPVWSVAFSPDDRTLYTGGADRLIRRWDPRKGEPIGSVSMSGPEDPLAAYAGDHGAEVFRACVACHTLKRGEGPRAGPSLHGVFGRKIATLPDYDFTPALKKLDIVWSAETISKLFEVGPAQYTPGTKMPEQIIGSKEDRDALVEFLKKATR